MIYQAKNLSTKLHIYHFAGKNAVLNSNIQFVNQMIVNLLDPNLWRAYKLLYPQLQKLGKIYCKALNNKEDIFIYHISMMNLKN